MRSFITPLLVAGLAAAAPAPQNIDFDLVYEAPKPTYTIAQDVAAQTVVYDPASVIASAAAQITAAAPDESSAPVEKRAACNALPAGTGPPVNNPDTPAAFLASQAFADSANNAGTPSGYTQTFKNLKASNNAYGYLGFTTLDSYDVQACAAKCDAINGCMSFNLFYERDPSAEPGAGCPDPPSVTNIKCVAWGGPVSQANANNKGQYREQFQVVIAGSNGYQSKAIAEPEGYGPYGPAQVLGNKAINAPLDVNGFDTYMGSVVFSTGAFDATLCAAACDEKSKYHLAHPPSDGTPVQTCQFFNTYLIYINTPDNVEGQYCAMYSQSWSAQYATNEGQWRGNDHFMISHSFAYSNAADPGKPNPGLAVNQASKDIAWHSLQPFCSTLLGYNAAAVKTVTATATTTPQGLTTTTTTVTVTTTSAVRKRQEDITEVPESVSSKVAYLSSVAAEVEAEATATATEAPVLNKRAEATTPDQLTRYPASIVSSACSQNAKPASSTSSTTITNTITAASQLATVTETATTTTTARAAAVPSDCGKTIRGSTTRWDIDTSCNRRRASGGQPSVSTQSSLQACLQEMDKNPRAFLFDYEYATKRCTSYIYGNQNAVRFSTEPAEGFAFGVYEILG